MYELINRLRNMADMLDTQENKSNLIVPAILRAFRESVDAIETLQAELAELKIRWDMYGGEDGITAMAAELERLRQFAASVKRDCTEPDKLYIHISHLPKEDTSCQD